MPIRKLEHYNIVTTKIGETIRFYTEVLGMKHGLAPGFAADEGAWIYDGTDTPVVHLLSGQPQHLAAMPAFFRERLLVTQHGAPIGTGVIDHMAFDCADYDDLIERLRDAGMPARENFVEGVNLRQIFVDDPNGVTLELNFR